MDATELAKQLKQAIDSGEVTVETLGENVVINFPEEKTSDEDIGTMSGIHLQVHGPPLSTICDNGSGGPSDAGGVQQVRPPL